MNYNQIQKLIPYVDENFITFPLATTKNVYIPFINFWQSLSTKEELKSFIREATAILKDTGYELRLKDEKDVYIYNNGEIEDIQSTVIDFQISTIFKIDEDNDGNVFVNVDPLALNIDIIDLLIKIIDK